MLSGEGPADAQGRGKDVVHRPVNPLLLARLAQVAQNGGVDIAVAGMTVHRDRESVPFRNFPDASHHLRERVAGNRDIFADAVGCKGGDGGTDATPDSPDFVRLLRRACRAECHDAARRGHIPDASRLHFERGIVVAVDFDDHTGADLRVELRIPVACDDLQTGTVHDLRRRGQGA